MRLMPWLREYRWSLFFSGVLHLGFLLVLGNANSASGSNRKTVVPLISLSELPDLGNARFKDASDLPPRPMPDTMLAANEKRSPNSVPPKAPPLPADSPPAPLPKKAPPAEQQSKPKEVVQESPVAKPQKNVIPKPSELNPTRTETVGKSQDLITSSPATPPKATPPPSPALRSNTSRGSVLQNNKTLSNIIEAASQLPAKAPPVGRLPRKVETNLLELLARTDLVPVGAPTTFSAIQAAPTAQPLSPEEAEAYSEQINRFIVTYWEVPVHLAGSKQTVVIRFTIQPSGKIKKYEIEQLSGNKALDDSVLLLIRELRFLPPLPDSYNVPVYEFGVRFSPQQFQF